LRHAGRDLDEARDALGSPSGTWPVAGGGPSTDFAGIELKLQLAERRNEDLSTALESAERLAHERLSESIAESAVLSDNFDDLAASHMTLRDEVAALQQQIVARDHELAKLRIQVAGTEHATAGEAAEALSVAIDELESDAIGHEYLVQALRRELVEARDSLERHEMDQRLLTRALKAEVENLRTLAAERDFVIHHQGQQLDATARRDLDEFTESDGPDREALGRELTLLRQRVDDKDAIVRRLRAELADLQERAATAAPGDAAELVAVLRNREDDLARTRDRVEFLRRVLREQHAEAAMEQSETAPPAPIEPVVSAVPVKHSPIPPRPNTINIEEFDVSKYQTNASLQREVEQSLTFQSAWPLIAVCSAFGGLGLLALAALAFLLT
jgi:hypothetical protein